MIKVFVYYNLHKKVFSVKALEGQDKGRVIAHASEITLNKVVFKVSLAGRNRVLKERRKNVHAGVVGYWSKVIDETAKKNAKTAVTYNPYEYSTFVYKNSEQPIYSAGYAYLKDKIIFV